MSVNLFERKQTNFVLWRTGAVAPIPALYIGARPKSLEARSKDFRELPLKPSSEFPNLWEIPAADCGLADSCFFLRNILLLQPTKETFSISLSNQA